MERKIILKMGKLKNRFYTAGFLRGIPVLGECSTIFKENSFGKRALLFQLS